MATTPTPQDPTSPPPLPPPFLPPHKLRSLARAWLDEDTPSPDPASSLVGPAPRRAQLLCKSTGVLAGCPLAQATWEEAGCRVRWLVAEGAKLPPTQGGLGGEFGGVPTLVGEVVGPGGALLSAERVALNCLGRCSGVATLAARAVEVAKIWGWGGVVAGTRKTTPGFRLAEKYALEIGGADPHRPHSGGGGLLLLKDNHLAAAGEPLEKVVGEGRRRGGFSRLLGVEVATVAQGLRAAEAGADLILLDNFTPQALKEAAAEIKRNHPKVKLEASGGVTLELLPHILDPHLDVVSMGCLTHSAPALDFALRLLPGDP